MTDKQHPVAWCALTASGDIAYFDGKPMVMVGPVGNEHHQTALYAAPKAQPAPPPMEQDAMGIAMVQAWDVYDEHPFSGSVHPLFQAGFEAAWRAQPAPAQRLSDARILEISDPFGAFQYGDAQGHKRIAFARAVLAGGKQ